MKNIIKLILSLSFFVSACGSGENTTIIPRNAATNVVPFESSSEDAETETEPEPPVEEAKYDSNWQAVVSIVGPDCAHADSDGQGNSLACEDRCDNNKSLKPADYVNGNPFHTFLSCDDRQMTPLEASMTNPWTVLIQGGKNNNLGLPNNAGNMNLKGGAGLEVSIRSIQEGDYYVSVDGEYSAVASLRVFVNGTGSQVSSRNGSGYNSCYFPQKFRFNAGTNTLKFQLIGNYLDSIRFDAYRISEEIPSGVPLCN